MPHKTPYADLGDLDEDSRIGIIGDTVMRLKQTVGFVTDVEPGKADRYIQKLKERFPGIVIISRFAGPTAHAVTVKVGPPPLSNN